MAGLKDIPAYVRQANDQELLELALLENLQRENLNAIEIALSYKRLMEEIDLTQEQVAERMGKERSTVTNYIRLLKLPPDIQVAVRNNKLSMGHARTLIGVENVDQQLFVFAEIMKNGLSVRQTEELVRKVNQNDKPNAKKPAKASLPPAYQKIQDNLASHFSTKVNLDRGKTVKAASRSNSILMKNWTPSWKNYHCKVKHCTRFLLCCLLLLPFSGAFAQTDTTGNRVIMDSLRRQSTTTTAGKDTTVVYASKEDSIIANYKPLHSPVKRRFTPPCSQGWDRYTTASTGRCLSCMPPLASARASSSGIWINTGNSATPTACA